MLYDVMVYRWLYSSLLRLSWRHWAELFVAWHLVTVNQVSALCSASSVLTTSASTNHSPAQPDQPPITARPRGWCNYDQRLITTIPNIFHKLEIFLLWTMFNQLHCLKTLDSSLQGTCFITIVYSSHLLLLHRDKDTRIEKYYFE